MSYTQLTENEEPAPRSALGTIPDLHNEEILPDTDKKR